MTLLFLCCISCILLCVGFVLFGKVIYAIFLYFLSVLFWSRYIRLHPILYDWWINSSWISYIFWPIHLWSVKRYLMRNPERFLSGQDNRRYCNSWLQAVDFAKKLASESGKVSIIVDTANVKFWSRKPLPLDSWLQTYLVKPSGEVIKD